MKERIKIEVPEQVKIDPDIVAEFAEAYKTCKTLEQWFNHLSLNTIWTDYTFRISESDAKLIFQRFWSEGCVALITRHEYGGPDGDMDCGLVFHAYSRGSEFHAKNIHTEIMATGGNDRQTTGNVYFVQCNGGPIKIGFADNVHTRIKSLKTGNPYPLRLLATIRGGISKERKMHKRFKHLRISGEWFSPGEDLLKLIAEIQGEKQ